MVTDLLLIFFVELKSNSRDYEGEDLFDPIYGDGYITDILCGVKVRLSPLSFYQVNHDTAELLYNKAKEYAALTKEDDFLDLYCGTGTIGLSMANTAKSLIGVEIIPDAIEDAKLNAKLNNIDNANFICGDAADAFRLIREIDAKNPLLIAASAISSIDIGCDRLLCRM